MWKIQEEPDAQGTPGVMGKGDLQVQETVQDMRLCLEDKIHKNRIRGDSSKWWRL